MTTLATVPRPISPAPAYDDDAYHLIRRVAAGDVTAFVDLYEWFAPGLIRYLEPRLGQPELAEEVCQDVLLVVWQKAAQFEPRSRLSTWIFGIARRLAWKARSRQAAHDTEPLSAAPEEAGVEGPEIDFDRQADYYLVWQMVAALPPVLRQTVTLRYEHEYTYREIADEMGCATDTVKVRLSQSRRRLVASLRRSERSDGMLV